MQAGKKLGFIEFPFNLDDEELVPGPFIVAAQDAHGNGISLKTAMLQAATTFFDTNLLSPYPDYTNPALDEYASRIKFFEQAFEWNIMSYYFYPFYTARSANWQEMYQIDNDDPIFRSFLQSGMARVILSVTPGFEEAVLYFMETGLTWNGGQVPTPGTKMYRDIVADLQMPLGTIEETWETRLPTSLTIIQAGTMGLNVEQALPCDDDCGDYSEEYENPFSHETTKKLQGQINTPPVNTPDN